MKILIDTNILISAALNPGGTPHQAFMKAVSYPYQGVICEQNLDELHKIFQRKFPTKIPALKSFLSLALLTLEIIPTPPKIHTSEHLIRDVKDRPILRSAIYNHVDILLTGDKDFLESNLTKPKPMTASEFLSL